MPDSAPIAIIGAGPYGLALAYVLQRDLGLEPRVFGIPMEAWTNQMPVGMFLKSEGRASSIVLSEDRLSLGRFCSEVGADYGDTGTPVPLDTFIAYGRWFQRETVPHVEETRVEAIAADGGRFRLRLENGEEVPAGRVVIATGIGPYAHVPDVLRDAPGDLVTHSATHRDFRVFAGRRVAVIGYGQSALESSTLIGEAGGGATLVARAREIPWNALPLEEPRSRLSHLRYPYAPLGACWPLWMYSNLAYAYSMLPESQRRERALKTLGPAGAWWLRDRFMRHVDARTGHSVVRWEPRPDGIRLVLRGPSTQVTLDVDHVVAATGFRTDLSRLGFLAPELRSSIRMSFGAPVLSRALESSVPGLHFTGATAMTRFGPLMRFVCGAEYAARRVAEYVRDAP